MTTDTSTTDLPDDTDSKKTDNPNFIENDLARTPDKAFRDYALDDRLVDALEAKGISHPFPIQELTLPVALQGQDIIGQARTGTGKTLGFGLPMIQRLTPGVDHTQALIVTPTRELCIQVYEELRICEAMGYTSTTVYGGVGYDEQTEALTGGVDIVVGTPGRLLDMLGRGILDLSKVSCVILDEADEMLDMGFLPDVERLLNAANSDGRHTMLFSATMPATVVKLARRYTDNPLFMGADSVEHETAPTVDQHFFQVFRMDKPRVLARILQQPGRGNVYVFCRTKAMCDRLVRELEDLGVPAIAIHGDLRQAAREKNLDKFRDGNVGVLVATEVAARGIDVENVTHVINYDLPDDEKMYLHRIGRTARAGNSGVAVTFAEHNELARLHMIKKAVQQDVETIEVFSTSDTLTETFDLPEETPWGHLAKSRSGGGRSGGGRSSGGRSGGSDSGGRSSGGSGSRGRPHSSKGSLDSPRGSKHDADLESDHDRDRDRVRKAGDSVVDPAEERARSRSRSRSGGSSRSSSSSRSSGSSRSDGGSRAKDDGGSRDDSRSRDRSSSRSSSSDDGRTRDRSTSRSRSSSRDEGDNDRSRDRSRERRSEDGSDRDTSSRQRSSSSERDGGRSRSSSSSSRSSSRSSSGGRVRARGGKPVGDRSRGGSSDDESGGGRSGGSSTRSSSSRSRSGGSSSGRDRDGGNRGSSSRSGNRNQGGNNRNGSSSNRGGGGGNNRGGNNRGKGGGRNQGGNGGRSNDAGTVDLPRKVRPTRSGTTARGEGNPRLERRVEIEHLP